MIDLIYMCLNLRKNKILSWLDIRDEARDYKSGDVFIDA